MAVINIDDAYILNETGAQVDKVTGLFTKDEDTTSGEKAFAQLNIGAAGSNRNLLDNPWFTVNQRGKSSYSYSANAYTVDRWKFNNYGPGAGTVTLLNPGIRLVGVNNNQTWLTSRIPDILGVTGKTLTFSVIADGVLRSFTFTCPDRSATSTVVNQIIPNGFLVVRRTASNLEYGFEINLISTNNTTPVDFTAVKLELGSVSTLANDAPPDYGEELLKCQRYFTRWYSTAGSSAIGLALAVGTTNANFALLSNLRAEGSATVSFTGLVLSDGTDKTVTNVSVAGAGDGKSMRLLVTSSGLTAYRPYVLQITAGGHLDVSKDL